MKPTEDLSYGGRTRLNGFPTMMIQYSISIRRRGLTSTGVLVAGAAMIMLGAAWLASDGSGGSSGVVDQADLYTVEMGDFDITISLASGELARLNRSRSGASSMATTTPWSRSSMRESTSRKATFSSEQTTRASSRRSRMPRTMSSTLRTRFEIERQVSRYQRDTEKSELAEGPGQGRPGRAGLEVLGGGRSPP